jgi:hypothetical protein
MPAIVVTISLVSPTAGGAAGSVGTGSAWPTPVAANVVSAVLSTIPPLSITARTPASLIFYDTLTAFLMQLNCPTPPSYPLTGQRWPWGLETG